MIWCWFDENRNNELVKGHVIPSIHWKCTQTQARNRTYADLNVNMHNTPSSARKVCENAALFLFALIIVCFEKSKFHHPWHVLRSLQFCIYHSHVRKFRVHCRRTLGLLFIWILPDVAQLFWLSTEKWLEWITTSAR